MERLTLGIISTLLISAAASPGVHASKTTINAATLDTARPTYLAETSPFNLVQLAYRGYFADRGIPSYQALVSAYSLGKISAEDLVQTGVETGRLSPNAINDQGYINAVEKMLNNRKTR